MNPVVTIILPVYNTERYLSACLDSLCSQTLLELEILCINDGSTDRSGEILDEYAQKDTRVRVLHQVNSGVACSRNRGLAEARGKYLLFCDSDDWYEQNMCELMYRTIEEKNVDFVMCNTFVDLVGRVQKISGRYLFPRNEGRYTLHNNIRLQLNGSLWNKIFRKDIVRRYNISFPNVLMGEDDAFCRSYFFVSKTVYLLNRKLYHYVIRRGSLTAHYQKNTDYNILVAPVKAVEHVFYFLKRNNFLENNEAPFSTYYLKFCMNVWRSLPTKFYPLFLEEIRHFVLENKIVHWPKRRGKRLYQSLCNGDDVTAAKILDNVPDFLKRLMLLCKYFVLTRILSAPKKKRYYKKLIHLLYQPRKFNVKKK